MPDRPRRLLVVLPSWVGDAVMATPALRLLRDALPGACIGGLMRPGIDTLLAPTGADDALLDDAHIARSSGVMGPKRAAAAVRGLRYDAALLLTNSFSTALATRMAFIPRRIGYDRDGRGVLLTDRLRAPKDNAGRWRIVPAIDYYWAAARYTADGVRPPWEDAPDGWDQPEPDRADRVSLRLPVDAHMELPVTQTERAEAVAVLDRAGVDAGEPIAVLNPGGNNTAKRWPAERFVALARWLREAHGLQSVVAGSPGEAELAASIASEAGAGDLPSAGLSLGALKGVIARALLVVTNDTGPRHIAVALRTPVVTLFGPTDARWTTVPAPGGEALVLADPDLPPNESANDHGAETTGRCAIERIEIERVQSAIDALLAEHPA